MGLFGKLRRGKKAKPKIKAEAKRFKKRIDGDEEEVLEEEFVPPVAVDTGSAAIESEAAKLAKRNKARTAGRKKRASGMQGGGREGLMFGQNQVGVV